MDAPKPRRFRFQISLRTLLLLVTIACAGFGWLGYKVRQAQQQKEAMEAIRKAGGEVWYEYQFDSNNKFDESATPPGPAWLRELVGDDFFADVYLVIIEGSSFTNSELAHLQGISRIENLRLVNTPITDAGLVHLQGISRLERLWLVNTPITDAGLVHLQGLTQLKELTVDRTNVTLAGCKELHNALPNLIIRGGSGKAMWL